MHTSDEIGTTTTNTQTRPPIFKLHRTTIQTHKWDHQNFKNSLRKRIGIRRTPG